MSSTVFGAGNNSNGRDIKLYASISLQIYNCTTPLLKPISPRTKRNVLTVPWAGTGFASMELGELVSTPISQR